MRRKAENLLLAMEILNTEKRDTPFPRRDLNLQFLQLIWIFRQLRLKSYLFHIANPSQQAYLSPFPRNIG
jgi:hypothetical protein